mgnify:CR=1 FL=1
MKYTLIKTVAIYSPLFLCFKLSNLSESIVIGKRKQDEGFVKQIE